MVEVTGFEPDSSSSIGDDRRKYGHLSLPKNETPAVIGFKIDFTSSFLHRLFNIIIDTITYFLLMG